MHATDAMPPTLPADHVHSQQDAGCLDAPRISVNVLRSRAEDDGFAGCDSHHSPSKRRGNHAVASDHLSNAADALLALQSHAALVVLDCSGSVVTHASTNAAGALGCVADVSLGCTVEEVSRLFLRISSTFRSVFDEFARGAETTRAIIVHAADRPSPSNDSMLWCTMHRLFVRDDHCESSRDPPRLAARRAHAGGGRRAKGVRECIALEFEFPVTATGAPSLECSVTESAAARVVSGFTRDCFDELSLATAFASSLREITKFDRVAVCKFVTETTCEVVAESLTPAPATPLTPIHSLLFGASDFTLRGRLPADGALRSHHVIDALGTGAAVVSLQSRGCGQSACESDVAIEGDPTLSASSAEQHPHTAHTIGAESIAMSVVDALSQLHVAAMCPSGDHCALMGMLGARSEAVYPVLVDGLPWGLVVCHGTAAVHVTPPLRAAMARCVRLFGMDIERLAVIGGSREAGHERESETTLLRKAGSVSSVSSDASLTGFINRLVQLLPVYFEADGAAILHGGRMHSAGVTPTEQQVRELVSWLPRKSECGRPSNATLPLSPLAFTRDPHVIHLSAMKEHVTPLKSACTGVLAMHLPTNIWLLSFRRESPRIVRWGGSIAAGLHGAPSALALGEQPGEHAPRPDTLRGTCLPWTFGDAQRAASLRVRVVEEIAARLPSLESAVDSLRRELGQKSEFISTMSHEIRTPMNSMLGFLSLLSESGGLDAIQHSYVDNIKGSGEHLLSLINDILDLTRLESVPLDNTAFPLLSVAEECSNMFAPMCTKKGIDLIFETEDNIPDSLFIVSDKMKLKQLIINLLGNATKFTSEGHVALRIGCEVMGGSPLSSQRSSPPSSPSRECSEADRFVDAPTVVVSIVVEDTGCGIPEDSLRKIFEPFIQAHASDYGGTGLGLAISRRIAQAMGGDIVAESAVNSGTRFMFVCPFRIGTAPLLSRESSGAGDSTMGGFGALPRKRSSLRDSASGAAQCASPSGASRLVLQTSDAGVDPRPPAPHTATDTGGDTIFRQDSYSPTIAAQEAAVPRRRRSVSVVLPPSSSSVRDSYLLGGDNDIPETEGHARTRELLGLSPAACSGSTGPDPATERDLVQTPRTPSSSGLARSVSVTLDSPSQIAQSRSLDGGAMGLAFASQASAPFAATALKGENLSSWRRRFAGLRVLVVEDNSMNFKILNAILTKLAIQHDWAQNGLLALDCLKASTDEVPPRPYAVVMMDMVMPEMDGLVATRHIRNGEAGAMYTHVPIVALTANASSDDADACRQGGMDAFLSKPFSVDSLVSVLDMHVTSPGGAPRTGAGRHPLPPTPRTPS
eukprot:Opistho-2@42733